MKKRIARTAVYAARNALVAAGIRETLPGNPGSPLALSIRMFPNFRGRLSIRDAGGTVVIECKDEASKNALIDALQNAFAQRDLDERRWTNVTETRGQR